MDVEPVGRSASLSGVAELGGHCAGHRCVEVSVCGHDEGRIATKLHARVEDALGCLLQQRPADCGRAREADLANAVVVQPGGDDGRGVEGGHNVDHAVGRTRIGDDPCQREGGQRRFRSRLEHDRASGRERWGDLPRGHRCREVPRSDQGRDTDGFVRDDRAGAASRGAAVHAVRAHGLLAEPAEELGRVGHLGTCVGERLSVLPGDQGGQRLGVGKHQVIRLAQHVRSGSRCCGRPDRERRGCSIDG